MTSSAASPVNAVNGFELAGDDSFPQLFELYKLVTEAAERVESIHLLATYPQQPDLFQDVYVIQLVDQSGLTLSEIPTPALSAPTNRALEAHLSWGRGLNGTEQQAALVLDNAGILAYTAWVTLGLPDFYLEPGSTVMLTYYDASGGEQSPIPISDASITVTRQDTGDTSTQPIGGLIPLLAPLPLEEQG